MDTDETLFLSPGGVKKFPKHLRTPAIRKILGTAPTARELVQWAYQWAKELWLCDYVDPTDRAWFDDTIFGLYDNKSSDEPENFHFEEDNDSSLRLINEALELNAQQTLENEARIYAAQKYPEVRREANLMVDKMLRTAGVSDEDIRKFKQVLPYKMAHLSRMRRAQKGGVKEPVPLWVLEERFGVNDGNFIGRENQMTRPVHRVQVDARLEWAEVSKRLEMMAQEPGTKPRFRYRDWEYQFLIGDRTNRKSGQDGAIRAEVDWRHVVRNIQSKTSQFTGAIFFRVKPFLIILLFHLAFQLMPPLFSSRNPLPITQKTIR